MGLPAVPMTAARLRTKKIGCPVKITVKMIAKFPQFKVSFCLIFLHFFVRQMCKVC